jgi:hypothetical protein
MAQGFTSRGRMTAIAVTMLVLGLLIGTLLMGAVRLGSLFDGPDPESVAAASLQSVREQARLTPFAARFVAVVTSSQTRFGLTAEKTLIMPGTVRYELDLAKLGPDDLEWSADQRRLTVTLPPIELSRPQVEVDELREYSGGRPLLGITGTEQRLDAANRTRAQQELVRQARGALPMRLARDAAKRMVERTFELPLDAAGIEAEVVTRFADEPSSDPSFLDRSRRIEDVLKERETR